jgi:hypothetical protein
MSSDEPRTDITLDEIDSSPDFHDLAEFTRGGQTRRYLLRVIEGGAELWRVTETPGEETESIRETRLRDSDECAAFLREMERALKAGGWTAA